jgi:tRNA pseudouridine13 synthase
MPNYFGAQRFGHDGGNVVDARWAARKALPEQRNVRSRLLSTARSYLFNQVLAARVADGSWQRRRSATCWHSPTAAVLSGRRGGMCRPAPGDSRPAPDRPAVGRGRFAGWRAAAEWKARCGEAGPVPVVGQAAWPRTAHSAAPHWRLTWHYPEPDILQLEFVLPAGCFATVVVRELVDLVPAGQTDSPCVF